MAFWWVNQKQSYKAEREGGYMWAPLVSAAGYPLSHWESMTLVRPGDVVFHHARGIRALGSVVAAAVPSPMPAELPEMWDRDGRIVKVDYADVLAPIMADEIPLDRRIAERGPFASTGRVNQGYLYPVSTAFAEWLLDTFSDRFGRAVEATGGDEGGSVLPADPALRKAVETFAVDRVVADLEHEYGKGRVRKMPTNNPGYDVEVDRPGIDPLSVEVKGTLRSVPVFLMSETERAYSAANADRYELRVVWGIDLATATCQGIEVRSGEVARDTHGLTVQRWQGRLT